jgi:hypothetical protein
VPKNVLKTVVYDADTNDLILERIDVLSQGSKVVILKLPLTGKKIIIETFSKQLGRRPLGYDQTFNIPVPQILPLKTWNVDIGSGDREFMNFIKKFVVDLPNLPGDGKLRRSPSGRFKIVLKDKLTSYSGEVLPTPCMIGKKTGTIEVSKDYFLNMSQSQRIATLTHEYGHFYKNPLMNLEIGDEVGADLNGMTLYVGNGFHLAEYDNAFKKVFKYADTEQNRERAKLIKGFGRRIVNGQYFGKPYNL